MTDTKINTEEKPFSLSFRVIIRDRVGRCLLLKRSASCREKPNKWDFPGGKLELQELFNDALHREVKEETGVDVKLEGSAGIAEFELDSVRVVCLIMRGEHISGEVTISEEHDEFKWVFLSEISVDDFAEWFHPFLRTYIIDM